MRILHVLDHGLPLQSGYTFRTRAILKAQIARGWQVAAVTGARHGASQVAHEVVDGLDFYRTPPPANTLPVLSEWRELGALAERVLAVARDFPPGGLPAPSPVLAAL